MAETSIYFGSLDSRSLHLRFWTPHTFDDWDYDRGFYLAPLKLLNPVRWWRTIFNRWSWRFKCRRYEGAIFRCYCMTGSGVDGCLFLAGFGVQWFYSHYTGELPCWCDKALAELEEEAEEVDV